MKFLVLTWRAYANYADWLFSLRKKLRGDALADFCCSGDYAAHLAYTTFCAIRLMKHTIYADYADKITYT